MTDPKPALVVKYIEDLGAPSSKAPLKMVFPVWCCEVPPCVDINIFKSEYFVHCSKCGRKTLIYDTCQEAVATWNEEVE